jgi:hypothetical protein
MSFIHLFTQAVPSALHVYGTGSDQTEWVLAGCRWTGLCAAWPTGWLGQAHVGQCVSHKLQLSGYGFHSEKTCSIMSVPYHAICQKMKGRLNLSQPPLRK